MKQRFTLILFLSLLMSASFVAAQFNGAYTINSGAAVSASNYQTFTAALQDLVGARADGGPDNGLGVSGPVVFSVANGNYTEQFSIPAITGTSAINTVTFRGNVADSSLVRILHASNVGSNYVVEFNATSFITFQYLSLERTGVSSNLSARVVDIVGATQNISLLNCKLKSSHIGTSANAIVVNNQGNFLNPNTVIRNCYIENGRSGIYFLGNPGAFTREVGTIVEGNTLVNQVLHGMWLQLHSSPIVRNNSVVTNTTNAGANGIYCQDCDNALRIENNVVTGFTQYGINVNLCDGNATGSNEGVIANNFIYMTFSTNTNRYALYLQASTRQKVFYNTVHQATTNIGTAAGSSSACFLSGGSNHEIRNNVFASTGGGYAISNSASTPITASHNCLYTSGTNLAYWNSAVRIDLAALQTVSSQFANSIQENPLFVTPDNYVLNNTNVQKSGTATGVSTYVTLDIEGETRHATTPDMGCDEQPASNDDAGITTLDGPFIPICPGVNSPLVTLKNFGDATLTSATIGWSVNGLVQTPFNWVGSLAPSATETDVSIGSYNFLENINYTLKIWTQNPNGNSDGNAANDTLLVTNFRPAMGGIYTLGASGDFSSFQDALDSLNVKGICSDVNIQVQSGTYTEQLVIDPIMGAGTADGPGKTASSLLNRIVFEGLSGDSTDVILTFGAATFADNYVIKLDGADYITFRKMTIRSTDPFENQVVMFTGGASFNEFSNNRLETISGANADAIVISPNTTTTDSNNVFRSNYFLNGLYGISALGTAANLKPNWVVEYNTFEIYRFGASFTYIKNLWFNGNRVFNAASFNAPASMGLECFHCDSILQINANRITLLHSTNNTGMHIQACTGPLGAPCSDLGGVIANNQIIVGSGNGASSAGAGDGTGSAEGIYTQLTTNKYFLYNSINAVATNPTTSRAFYVNGPQSGVPSLNANFVVLNNVFASTGGGYAIVNSVGGIIQCDYNAFYSPGTTHGEWIDDATNLTSLAVLQGLSSDNANSLFVDPQFTNPISDLTPLNAALEDAGTSTCIATDINGNPRDGDPGMGALEPTPVLALGLLDFQIRVVDAAVELDWQWIDNQPVETVLLRGFSPEAMLPIANVSGQFSFLDQTILLNTRYYYRLEGRDTDGSIAQSNVLSALVVDHGQMVLHPNPASGQVTLVGMEAGDQITVSNSIGQVVLQVNASGNGEVIFAVDNWNSGLYTLSVLGANGQLQTLKFIVQP